MGMRTEMEEGGPWSPPPPDPDQPTFGAGPPPSPRPHKPHISRGVMNLSNTDLTEDQHRVLERGLKFIPTPIIRKPERARQALVDSAEALVRKIHIIYYFHKHRKRDGPQAPGHGTGGEQLPYCANSEWEPPLEAIPPLLRRVGDIITSMARKARIQQDEPNLTRAQRAALAQLVKLGKEKLTIRKADKGSAAVIQDRDDYLWEGERQLLNEKYYQRLRRSWFHYTSTLIPPTLDDWKARGLLKPRQHQFLQPPWELRPRRFYMLPKIHKDPSKWPVPNRIPPGRPIVSDCSSEGYPLSELLDHFLQMVATTHPSYLKDTWDFIQFLNQLVVPPKALIVTCDVASMYTNIDIPAALEVITRRIDSIRGTPGLPPTEDFIRMLRLSLERNDFKFNGSFYLQLKGTAMGKKYAPAFANIFMADWEHTMLRGATLQPLCYKRFLDDIFLIWTHGEQQLTTFITYANSLDPSVQLEAEVDPQGVAYLDTYVYKGPRHQRTGLLDVRLYTKPTSSLDLLDAQSYHPKATFRGIVKSQLIRYWNISTDEVHYNRAVRNLFHNIRKKPKSRGKKGYDKRLLRRVKMEVRLEREGHIPTRLWPKEICLLLKKPPLRGTGVAPCRAPRCRTCRHVPLTQGITTPLGTTLYPQTLLTCKTTDIIYLIICTRCQARYIGETGRSLAHRMWEHRHNIMTNNGKGLADHFNRKDHQGIYDLLACPVLSLPPSHPYKQRNTLLRRRLEVFCMKLFHTLPPDGLNRKEEAERKRLPVVVRYGKTQSQWIHMVRHLWTNHIQPTYPAAFGNYDLVAAYQRSPNLGEHLARAKDKGRPTQLTTPLLDGDCLQILMQLEEEANSPGQDTRP